MKSVQKYIVTTLRYGSEQFVNMKVSTVLMQRSTEKLITFPQTLQQNAAAAQENRTIVEPARSMLSSSKLTKFLWDEECNTTVYVLNRSKK